MKKNYFIIIIILISLTSCFVENNESEEIIIKGYSKDIFRGTESPNVKVILYEQRSNKNFPYHTYGVKIDSTITNQNGQYYLNYLTNGNNNYFIEFYNNTHDNSPYYFELINKELYDTYLNRIYVKLGIENEINVNAFYPNILKVKTNIQNNTNHKLYSSSSYESNLPYYNWKRSSVIITSQNIDTTYYLTARPDSNMLIYFNYNPTPNDIHSNPKSKIYNFNTNTNDTISLSYNINCNTF
jgi:hypothetical protein